MSRCNICAGYGTAADALRQCSSCGVVVHGTCYAAPPLQAGKVWHCRLCESGVGTPSCVLCERAGGAMLPTADSTSGWCHVSCANFLGAQLDASTGMVSGIAMVSTVRFKLICELCGRGGACMQCSRGKCLVALHPSCALERICSTTTASSSTAAASVSGGEKGGRGDMGAPYAAPVPAARGWQWKIYCGKHAGHGRHEFAAGLGRHARECAAAAARSARGGPGSGSGSGTPVLTPAATAASGGGGGEDKSQLGDDSSEDDGEEEEGEGGEGAEEDGGTSGAGGDGASSMRDADGAGGGAGGGGGVLQGAAGRGGGPASHMWRGDPWGVLATRQGVWGDSSGAIERALTITKAQADAEPVAAYEVQDKFWRHVVEPYFAAVDARSCNTLRYFIERGAGEAGALTAAVEESGTANTAASGSGGGKVEVEVGLDDEDDEDVGQLSFVNSVLAEAGAGAGGPGAGAAATGAATTTTAALAAAIEAVDAKIAGLYSGLVDTRAGGSGGIPLMQKDGSEATVRDADLLILPPSSSDPNSDDSMEDADSAVTVLLQHEGSAARLVMRADAPATTAAVATATTSSTTSTTSTSSKSQSHGQLVLGNPIDIFAAPDTSNATSIPATAVQWSAVEPGSQTATVGRTARTAAGKPLPLDPEDRDAAIRGRAYTLPTATVALDGEADEVAAEIAAAQAQLVALRQATSLRALQLLARVQASGEASGLLKRMGLALDSDVLYTLLGRAPLPESRHGGDSLHSCTAACCGGADSHGHGGSHGHGHGHGPRVLQPPPPGVLDDGVERLPWQYPLPAHGPGTGALSYVWPDGHGQEAAAAVAVAVTRRLRRRDRDTELEQRLELVQTRAFLWKAVVMNMERGFRSQDPSFAKRRDEEDSVIPASWSIPVQGRPGAAGPGAGAGAGASSRKAGGAGGGGAAVPVLEAEEEEEGLCCVCFSAKASDDNPLVYCDGCDVGMHRRCYGIADIPEGDYFCDACSHVNETRKRAGRAVAVQPVLCALCPITGGAMKRTSDGRWVHVACALWDKQAWICNLATMSPVELNTDAAARFRAQMVTQHEALQGMLARVGARAGAGAATATGTGTGGGGGGSSKAIGDGEDGGSAVSDGAVSGHMDATQLAEAKHKMYRAPQPVPAAGLAAAVLLPVLEPSQTPFPIQQLPPLNPAPLHRGTGGAPNAVASATQPCGVCGQSSGRTQRCCGSEACGAHFHPLCAWYAGLYMRVTTPGSTEDNAQCAAFGWPFAAANYAARFLYTGGGAGLRFVLCCSRHTPPLLSPPHNAEQQRALRITYRVLPRQDLDASDVPLEEGGITRTAKSRLREVRRIAMEALEAGGSVTGIPGSDGRPMAPGAEGSAAGGRGGGGPSGRGPSGVGIGGRRGGRAGGGGGGLGRSASAAAAAADGGDGSPALDDTLTVSRGPTPIIQLDSYRKDRCAVCFDTGSEEPLQMCSSCGVPVHINCYGLGKAATTPGWRFKCERCKAIDSVAGDARKAAELGLKPVLLQTGRPAFEPRCAICARYGGAFKATRRREWAHVFCAWMLPETTWAAPDVMEGLDLSRVDKKRYTQLRCSICRVAEGACVQCKQCLRGFHSMCGIQRNCYAGWEVDKASGVVLGFGYCTSHKPAGWRWDEGSYSWQQISAPPRPTASHPPSYHRMWLLRDQLEKAGELLQLVVRREELKNESFRTEQRVWGLERRRAGDATPMQGLQGLQGGAGGGGGGGAGGDDDMDDITGTAATGSGGTGTGVVVQSLPASLLSSPLPSHLQAQVAQGARCVMRFKWKLIPGLQHAIACLRGKGSKAAATAAAATATTGSISTGTATSSSSATTAAATGTSGAAPASSSVSPALPFASSTAASAMWLLPDPARPLIALRTATTGAATAGAVEEVLDGAYARKLQSSMPFQLVAAEQRAHPSDALLAAGCTPSTLPQALLRDPAAAALVRGLGLATGPLDPRAQELLDMRLSILWQALLVTPLDRRSDKKANLWRCGFFYISTGIYSRPMVSSTAAAAAETDPLRMPLEGLLRVGTVDEDIISDACARPLLVCEVRRRMLRRQYASAHAFLADFKAALACITAVTQPTDRLHREATVVRQAVYRLVDQTDLLSSSSSGSGSGGSGGSGGGALVLPPGKALPPALLPAGTHLQPTRRVTPTAPPASLPRWFEVPALHCDCAWCGCRYSVPELGTEVCLPQPVPDALQPAEDNGHYRHYAWLCPPCLRELGHALVNRHVWHFSVATLTWSLALVARWEPALGRHCLAFTDGRWEYCDLAVEYFRFDTGTGTGAGSGSGGAGGTGAGSEPTTYPGGVPLQH